MAHQNILSTIICIAIFGTLPANANSVKYMIVNNTIPVSLTGKPGDPVNGKKLAINRKKGNCLACHVMPIPKEQFHGEVGPDISDVGSHFTEAQLRLRLVDAKALNPDTIMPAFLKAGTHDVLKKFDGKTILGPQDIEDIIAYLMTLKGHYSQ
jgi:sulfur-oxidizing protein SoxX